MDEDTGLIAHCRITTGRTGDQFVGVKGSSDNITVCFPIGYSLPDKDDDLRNDIRNLFCVLEDFQRKAGRIGISSEQLLVNDGFPLTSYIEVMQDYLANGRYYTESERSYTRSGAGRICWSRTIRSHLPLLQNGSSAIFTSFTAVRQTPNEDREITLIHKYCVYDAFKKLGWLYVPWTPPPPPKRLSTNEAVYILQKKLNSTHKDAERKLFAAMVNILRYLSGTEDTSVITFGVDQFEHVWEFMVDRSFGISGSNKRAYFPSTEWQLYSGRRKVNAPLQPDTVMIYHDKVYILDAKYYMFGNTGAAGDLPGSESINKQITYGEFAARAMNLPDDQLFNAFIIPYNKDDNSVGLASEIECIGAAVGNWKDNMLNYERIKGIVVDTRYMMYHYYNMPDLKKRTLAEKIEENPPPHPRLIMC